MTRFWLILASVAGLSALSCGAAAATAPQVQIDSGALSGRLEQGIAVFKGLPYAAPPVGELRWRPPVAPAPWQGVRDAGAFGPACPQDPPRHAARPPMAEDCLTLNVYTPDLAPGAKLPVMVWIHGGGFIRGAGSLPAYDGVPLAREGVVVVTINYRLNIFGVFAHPALTAEARAESGLLANYGLMDQIAALKWVKRNIAAFGGDPGNVTIFGESAGGVSVLVHMLSGESRGLFHKAIAQSGGGRFNVTPLDAPGPSGRSAEEWGEDLALLMVPGTADPIAALRALPWEAFAEPVARNGNGRDAILIADGRILPGRIDAGFDRGRQARVPLMIGATSYEGILRRAFEIEAEQVFALAGDDLAAARALYADSPVQTDARLADLFYGDAFFVEPARYLAKVAAATGVPVHLYHFAYEPRPLRAFIPGSLHGLDVIYVLGTWDTFTGAFTSRAALAEAEAVSRPLMRAWANFARTGDPNGPGVPAWPRVTPAQDTLLLIGKTGTFSIAEDFAAARLDFWEGRFAQGAGR